MSGYLPDWREPYRVVGVVRDAAWAADGLDVWLERLEQEGARDVTFLHAPGDPDVALRFLFYVQEWLSPTLRIGHMLRHVLGDFDWQITIAPLTAETPPALSAAEPEPRGRAGGFEPPDR